MAGDVLHRLSRYSSIPDALILKLDANGNPLWQKLYVGGAYTHPFNVRTTVDGGYIVAGKSVQTAPKFQATPYLLKLDRSGKMIWQKNYGSMIFPYGDDFSSVEARGDNGLVVAGILDGAGAWVLKLNDHGDAFPGCLNGVVSNSTLIDVTSVARTSTLVTTVFLNPSALILTTTGVRVVEGNTTLSTQCTTGRSVVDEVTGTGTEGNTARGVDRVELRAKSIP